MTTSISKILIANRGEIACRIVKTARTLGIATVSVFCDAERNSQHVQDADEAYYIGTPPASTSYLRGDKILEVAKSVGAHAIHPGYGFLSENAVFADSVVQSGIEFIGPSAEAIRLMGSKSESKIIMEKSGIPVLNGYNGAQQDDETLQMEANRIGYPVLIKAVLGGGGKGMKLARNMDEFMPQLQSARREALNFFKDDKVILERYVSNPRHVEVQIIADKHGRCFHLYERDCSLQRRHQKVIEECPAILPDGLADEMGEVAVQAAKAVAYVGAGTVEFIYDADSKQYFFMEMNTRLQVEHPVTEEVVRIHGKPIDLVKLQIEIAMGQRLPFEQSDITTNGHALEARIYAESPREDFLPGSGTLHFVKEPDHVRDENRRIRIDTGFRAGDDVLVYYDPMISKLIVWGKDRNQALHFMLNALRKYHFVGIKTNIDFLQKCVEHPDFKKGSITTNFIEQKKKDLVLEKETSLTQLACASLLFLNIQRGVATLLRPNELHFRINHALCIELDIIDEFKRPCPVKVTNEPSACNTFTVTSKNDERIQVKIVKLTEQECVFLINSERRCVVQYFLHHRTVTLMNDDFHSEFSLNFPSLHQKLGESSQRHSNEILSPINGRVVKFCVSNGAAVAVGQTVLILEAMKMEHNIKAVVEGNVQFHCTEKSMVKADAPLATILPLESSNTPPNK